MRKSSDYIGACLGHMVNSSHPLLGGCQKYPNCVYAVYFNELVLSLHIPPKIRLYVVSAVHKSGGKGSNPQFELRCEYHWCLAYKMGFWCLDQNCKECIFALSDFITKVKENFEK